MNKRDFYKTIMERYTFDSEKIRRNVIASVCNDTTGLSGKAELEYDLQTELLLREANAGCSGYAVNDSFYTSDTEAFEASENVRNLSEKISVRKTSNFRFVTWRGGFIPAVSAAAVILVVGAVSLPQLFGDHERLVIGDGSVESGAASSVATTYFDSTSESGGTPDSQTDSASGTGSYASDSQNEPVLDTLTQEVATGSADTTAPVSTAVPPVVGAPIGLNFSDTAYTGGSGAATGGSDGSVPSEVFSHITGNAAVFVNEDTFLAAGSDFLTLYRIQPRYPDIGPDTAANTADSGNSETSDVLAVAEASEVEPALHDTAVLPADGEVLADTGAAETVTDLLEPDNDAHSETSVSDRFELTALVSYAVTEPRLKVSSSGRTVLAISDSVYLFAGYTGDSVQINFPAPVRNAFYDEVNDRVTASLTDGSIALAAASGGKLTDGVYSVSVISGTSAADLLSIVGTSATDLYYSVSSDGVVSALNRVPFGQFAASASVPVTGSFAGATFVRSGDVTNFIYTADGKSKLYNTALLKEYKVGDATFSKRSASVINDGGKYYSIADGKKNELLPSEAEYYFKSPAVSHKYDLSISGAGTTIFG
ncbi:hypothetical protein FACS1894120_4780 [Clostridia bacterium]|nr:hypothetical protein FACS1894120_4780 [Clostridia bacterium]